MKKTFLMVVLMMMVANTCFAGVVINSVQVNRVNQNTVNFNAVMTNPDNYEYHNVVAIVTFLDNNGNTLSPQTQTKIDFIRPNDRLQLSFNCVVPSNATNYKIDYVASNVVIPNYVYYQKTYPPLFPDNGNIAKNTISNIATRIILGSILR